MLIAADAPARTPSLTPHLPPADTFRHFRGLADAVTLSEPSCDLLYFAASDDYATINPDTSSDPARIDGGAVAVGCGGRLDFTTAVAEIVITCAARQRSKKQIAPLLFFSSSASGVSNTLTEPGGKRRVRCMLLGGVRSAPPSSLLATAPRIPRPRPHPPSTQTGRPDLLLSRTTHQRRRRQTKEIIISICRDIILYVFAAAVDPDPWSPPVRRAADPLPPEATGTRP